MISIKKGLSIPITGSPSNNIEDTQTTRTVAVTGLDFIDMKPTMFVKEGEEVKVGQKLFECKKTPGLIFTAPACGKIKSINRGDRRVFQTMEITSNGNEHIEFNSYKRQSIESYKKQEIRDLLVESGLWTTIRQRPFNKTPQLNSQPKAIFVSIIDTQPLSFNPKIVIDLRKEDFYSGLKILAQLAEKKVYLTCGKNKLDLPESRKIEQVSFGGIHPAGNIGTHIHFLEPVSLNKSVWHIGYQDVIAIGHLFKTGRLNTERFISLGGPRAKNPRIIKTKIGADLNEVIKDEINNPESTRTISGSILNGRTVDKTFHFLGHFTNQISFIAEDNSRTFLGWHSPGFNSFSQKRIYVSKLIPNRKFSLGSSTNGSPRAMVPTGSFEEITSLDILPTQLLRSLLSYDTDQAQDLGCLDFAEEDMAIYTFVSPGKIDFGEVLRKNLSKIEKEG